MGGSLGLSLFKAARLTDLWYSLVEVNIEGNCDDTRLWYSRLLDSSQSLYLVIFLHAGYPIPETERDLHMWQRP